MISIGRDIQCLPYAGFLIVPFPKRLPNWSQTWRQAGIILVSALFFSCCFIFNHYQLQYGTQFS